MQLTPPCSSSARPPSPPAQSDGECSACINGHQTWIPPPCPWIQLKNPRARRLKPLFSHKHETEPDVLTLVLNVLHCTASAKVNCGAVDQINLHISPPTRYESRYCCYSQGFKAEQNTLPWLGSIVVGSPACVGPGESQWSVVSRCG